MRFITKEIHAYLDYPVGFGLLVMPFVLGIGATNQLALWISLIIGMAAISLTFLTDHSLGVLRVLPYSFHLVVDAMVGIAFVTIPSVLGLSGIDAAYYLVVGLTVLAVVALHKSETAEIAVA